MCALQKLATKCSYCAKASVENTDAQPQLAKANVLEGRALVLVLDLFRRLFEDDLQHVHCFILAVLEADVLSGVVHSQVRDDHFATSNPPEPAFVAFALYRYDWCVKSSAGQLTNVFKSLGVVAFKKWIDDPREMVDTDCFY